MSADLLHEAAEVLRERAEAATPGTWIHNPINGIHTVIGSCVATTHRHVEDARRADAAYIATIHPTVGLALADLLDAAAEGLARRGVTARITRAESDATSLARLILGRAS
jgi:hypothetical protein